MALDYGKSASEVIRLIGGKENIVSAAHCATRLRLVIADNKKVSKEELEEVDGVKGVFEASGQLQLIYGTGTVNKVYDEFISQAGITAATKDEVKAAAAKQGNPLQRFVKTLGDIFVPIIPAIVASGFLMGIMESLNFMINNGFIALDQSSALFVLANMFANTAYVFLPVLIGFSGAKVFGANPFLGGIIGMIMVHPNLQNAWTMTGGVESYLSVFGLYEVPFVGYQGHVISVIIAVYIMANIEKFLHKKVPAMFDLFVTPLCSVFITGFVTMTVVGPIFNVVESNIIGAIQALISLPFGIGSAIMGALYAPTVITGIHHMYSIIDLGQIQQYGVTYWLPLASAANIAQGAAALAVALKTKDQKLKAMALPSSLSAFMGITEPAIFGVNVRFGKPFICGCIGGAAGAMFASIVKLGASGTGVTGIFGIMLCLNDPIKYIIMFIIAAVVAFVTTWMFGYKDVEKKAKAKVELPAPTETVISCDKGEIVQPVNGEVITAAEIPDPMFAAESMGPSVGINPKDGKVYAPADGTITMVFPTNHAVGITTDSGMEILIHIGVDTVNMEGKGFTGYVKQGDKVTKGQLLIEFDSAEIKEAGYQDCVIVALTNGFDCKDIKKVK